MKSFVFPVFFLFLSSLLLGQQRTIEYQASLSGFVATDNNLPFWAISNQYGLLPDGNGGLAELGLFSGFNTAHKIQFAYGISAAGYLSRPDNNLLLDQLYISGRWKKIRLDLGMIHRDAEYNGISSTNGNIIYSNNARTLPGYNLRTDYIFVPWTRKILSFRFNWADYQLIDDRFVDNTYLHNKSVFVKIAPWKRLEIVVGLEHWAQWGGDSPLLGKQPTGFKDYLRIVCGKEGGNGASQSDIINALGNHLGREHLAINYLADKYTLSFYHDIPFEDGSGTDFRSFPDGIYALYYGSKNKKQWISDFIYEFHYTKYQSGSRHDRPATPEEMEKQDPNDPFYGRKILGGNDNYFNNGEYQSGWTFYGRTIGSPLITARQPDEKGITPGVYNNRVIGHHIGLKGYAFRKIPYKTMLTYTLNYGIYSQPLADLPCKQFSFGLEAGIPECKNIPFHIDFGVYGDFGELLSHNLGFTLKLSRKATLGKIK